MHRARGFAAAAALFAISLTGCDEFEGVSGTIGGQVSIEGEGIDGVTVTLSDGTTTTTSGGGTFLFSDVPADIYQVLISGYPSDAVFDRTSDVVIILADGVTHNVNFNGTYLRTSSIWGRVTADGRGLGGVEVRLAGPSNSAAITTPNGEYVLSNLRAGEYTVEISNYPASDVAFASTRVSVTVLPHEARVVSFDGEFLRSATITGRVSVGGTGIPGIAVNLTGPENATDTTTTDAAGDYTFAELRSGEYHLDISGWDGSAYDFEVTSTTVTLASGETAHVPFDGVSLRAGGISGHVRVDGAGLDGVTVVLSGAADDTTATAGGGEYAFAELTAGDYQLAISGFDTASYNFISTASPTITLARGESQVIDFEGSSSQSATIAGYLYVDENPKNDQFESGHEDLLAYAGFPVVLQGPGATESRSGVTDASGLFTFTGLKAGSYRVVPNLTPAAIDALGAEGYAYGGRATGVSVTIAGGGSTLANLPVDITHQTITVKAVLGVGDRIGPVVEGVEVDLYATSADADAETDALASAVTDSSGTASFTFARAEENDRLVFTRVGTLPNENFGVTANSRMTLIYPLRHRTTAAPENIKIVNRRADLRFTAKVIETARGGGGPLEDWDTEYVTAGGGATPVDIEPTDSLGEVAFHILPEAADLPVTYTVRLADDQDGALGEQFEQTPLPGEDADSGTVTLTYTHYGLSLQNDTLDLGEINVRFATQTLVVGVHWERDHKGGYTTEGIYGDERPTGSRDALDILLLVRDELQGHLRPYRNADPNHDINVNGHTRNPGESGLVFFRNLPADEEFIVDIDVSGKRMLASRGLVDSWHDFGAYDVGAFGEQSGGSPQVLLCPLSTVYGLSACSTFAYVWTNSEVWGWVGSADYDGEPTPNDAIADRFGVSAPDVFANGLTVDLDYQGGLFAYDGSTEVGEKTPSGDFVVGDGEFRFSDIPTGRYTLSVTGDDDWGDSEDFTFLLFHNEDTDAGARQALSVTVPYLKTSISGTIVNDANRDNRVAYAETSSGIEVELLPVQGADTAATGQTDTTDIIGRFSFEDIIEGSYVVRASSDDYFLAGTNTVPIDHSPVLTTDARPAHRAITSGDDLPVWDYFTGLIDADAGTSGSQSDVADFTDADFVILFGAGSMSGRVTRPDDGNTTDTDSDPDPFEGLAVRVDYCEAALGGTRCQPGRFGARVSATNRRDGSWEANGLREGYHLVTVSFPTTEWQYGAPPGSTEPVRSYFAQLEGASADEDSLDFHLVPRTASVSDGSLSGRVTRDDDGGTTDSDNDPDPFGGLNVNVDYCEAPADANSCQPGRWGDRKSVTTDNDGSWEAENLQEGFHQVTVDKPVGPWEYGPPPGRDEPIRQYFVEVEGQTGTSADKVATSSSAFSQQAEDDTLDFHFVPRADGVDRHPAYGVLVLFYNSTGGPIWEDQGDWLTSKPIEEWQGVVLDDDDNVVELVVSGNSLRYTPTPLLDSLVHLRRLDLSSNGLRGIPDSFGNFDSLRVLDLSANNLLEGSIPTTFGNLTKLDTLDLELGSFSGTIPTELGNLTGLQYLNLGRNDLTGSIPTQLGSLTDLKYLKLEGNDLTGTIPTQLGSLTNLEFLDLSDNGLTGTIPTELRSLTSLLSLNLGGNELTGAFPDALTALTKLHTLRLGDNKLTGLPSDMSTMTALQWLWLDDNDLSGTFPTQLLDLPVLAGLGLSGNGYTGSIPSRIDDRGFDQLDLADNSFSGTIPSELGNVVTLYGLDLSGNSLSGAIPASLGSLNRLRSLWIHNNSLTGNIPSEFGNLTTLQELQVQGNSGLSGTLPATLTSLTSLYWFAAQGTDLCAPTDSAFQTWLRGVGRRNVSNCP